MKNILQIGFLTCLITSCGLGAGESLQQEVQAYLDEYSKEYQELYYLSSEAEWRSNIEIIEGDHKNEINARKAAEALAKFTGSKENIEKAQTFLSHKNELTPLQIRQLEVVLFKAANNPEIVEDLVKARIKADTEQNAKLFGYNFKLDGKSVSTNDIDVLLATENNLEKRLKAWEISKEVGKNLKKGLTNLRDLRNKTVQSLGYNDFFSYQISEYGMTSDEMMILMQQMIKELWPLYRELHTYARYELAKKYNVSEIPDMLPAHWVTNRWGQDWSAMIEVEGLNIDSILKTQTPEWIVKQGERFYVSLGFPELPKSFWEKSDLYPLKEGATYKKNNHASAWHVNLDKDLRTLMSIIPNVEWYETSHHELGHIYYFMTYSNPDVPVLLRDGANRAYHEALGSLIGLAAMQKPFLSNLNLLPKNSQPDEIKLLLKEALNYAVFIPFSAGVMAEFEYELYTKNLSEDQYNKKWWDLTAKYQGMVPPTERGEEFCDAASKTHINNDAAQYYDYALSYILLFQFHDYISQNLLKQDPHATNYYGSKEVGKFLHDLMYPGSSKDWRTLLKETTGEDMSARAMVNYFQPLIEFLRKENTGRKYTLTEPV